MSVQFGKCNFDGKPADHKDLEEVRPVLAPYGPDGEGYICKNNFAVLYRAFHTTEESRLEIQPYTSRSGVVLTWDGRLDNRKDLIREFSDDVSCGSTDVEIVAAAFQCLGTEAFARLIGDWALSIWDPKDQSIILAKDFVGTRHLYYRLERDHLTWCTLLDPLVLFAGHSFEAEQEYIAGWLSLFPAAHLTPYTGIRSVVPATFLRIKAGAEQVGKYWDFNPARQTRYRHDSEYEEHFRHALRGSVYRRLRSDSPIAAELSGGMDSSSIVCMADHIAASAGFGLTPVNTVSYYDDLDPNWNERPYIAAVERRRGCVGFHVNIGLKDSVSFENDHSRFIASPAGALARDESAMRVSEHLSVNGIRVLLSGIGGDEVTGGVPTPTPEIADLIATLNIRRLAERLKTWALVQRRPWYYLLGEAFREFLPRQNSYGNLNPVPWLSREFTKRYKSALGGYATPLRFFGGLPSFQDNRRVLDIVRRQLAVVPLSSSPPLETRYPYLDRTLLEFLYSIPREQLVRPGQRRSLMRRALKEIVPTEVLTRRRKAYITRQPANLLAEKRNQLIAIATSETCKRIAYIDSKTLIESMGAVDAGDFKSYLPLVRTILFDAWLRSATLHSHVQIKTSSGGAPEKTKFSYPNGLKIQKKGGSTYAVSETTNR